MYLLIPTRSCQIFDFIDPRLSRGKKIEVDYIDQRLSRVEKNESIKKAITLKQYTTIPYLSAPNCGSSSGGPLHLGPDSFDCRPEKYNIDILLPNSYLKEL